MFKAWPKIPRLENEIYHLTEKIDGTNAAIIIQQIETKDNTNLDSAIWWNNSFCIYAQSRTRLIIPEDDNHGFAKWVKENAEQLINDLGKGYHFGEWWGQGIQRGYGLDHKRFSLFNPTKHSNICYNVPLLHSYNKDDPYSLDQRIKDVINLLLINGSYAAPGYMRPEGIVVYAEKAKTYWKVIIDK